VVRGYLTGSGLKQYLAEGQVCGVALPGGLDESSRLPAPIFTPTTKAATGHDLPLTFDETVDLVGRGLAERLREISIALYERGAEIAIRVPQPDAHPAHDAHRAQRVPVVQRPRERDDADPRPAVHAHVALNALPARPAGPGTPR